MVPAVGLSNPAHQCGLCGAVGADDAYELAPADLETYVPEHLHVAVAGLHFDNRQLLRCEMPASGIGLGVFGAEKGFDDPPCEKRLAYKLRLAHGHASSNN